MWLGQVPVGEVCQLHSKLKHDPDVTRVVGLLVLYGSWNVRNGAYPCNQSFLESLVHAIPSEMGDHAQFVTGVVQVDESDDSIQTCLGDNQTTTPKNELLPCPPDKLPALMIAMQDASMNHAVIQFVRGISAFDLLHKSRTIQIPPTWLQSVQDTSSSILSHITNKETAQPTNLPLSTEAIRIFVAGDRSQVGKSSMCFGILGSLVAMGYSPSSLAYIKPATQCEAPQLVQAYCEKVGIPCVPVGPIVYFKGFTRAFLAGDTESTDQLLQNAADAVDKLAQGKRVIMIDGVGFPSVGSICGTDNASVAKACGYPIDGGERVPASVLVIGTTGVGAAVDAFNLNATYFQAHNVPVMGAVFNKLPLEGFYSLESCRKEVTAYFNKSPSQQGRRPFGFVPQVDGIAGENPVDHADDFVRLFGEHVDVKGIIDMAHRFSPMGNKRKAATNVFANSRPTKLAKPASLSSNGSVLSRDEIERRAKEAGAAPSS